MRMTPLSVMWRELVDINHSFMVVFEQNTRKTKVMEGEIVVSEGENIDSAIYRAWRKVFGPDHEGKDGV